MLDLSLLADLALFIVTVVVVGKKPTSLKVAAVICLLWVVDYGSVCIAANAAHMNPIEWYQNLLNEVMGPYSQILDGQIGGYETTVAIVAGVSPAIYMVQSAAYIFIGLCIRWIANCVMKKSEWSPFSNVDLSIWWLVPLLLGLGLYTVSLFLQEQASHTVWLVSMNVLVVSVIPLFVQGAAAGKGIMNRMGLGFAWQLVIGVLGILSGVLFIAVPIIGLIDFWVNIRRLPRGDSTDLKARAD